MALSSMVKVIRQKVAKFATTVDDFADDLAKHTDDVSSAVKKAVKDAADIVPDKINLYTGKYTPSELEQLKKQGRLYSQATEQLKLHERVAKENPALYQKYFDDMFDLETKMAEKAAADADNSVLINRPKKQYGTVRNSYGSSDYKTPVNVSVDSEITQRSEKILNNLSDKSDDSNFITAGKYIVGGLALAGIINMISDSRGSMSNEQRFNPGGPFVL